MDIQRYFTNNKNAGVPCGAEDGDLATESCCGTTGVFCGGVLVEGEALGED